MTKFPEHSVHQIQCSFDQLIPLLYKNLKMNKNSRFKSAHHSPYIIMKYLLATQAQ